MFRNILGKLNNKLDIISDKFYQDTFFEKN